MAAPADFFDPFFQAPAAHHSNDELTPPPSAKLPPPSDKLQLPTGGIGTPAEGPTDLDLPVMGQGTISVRTAAKELLHLSVSTGLLGSSSFNLVLARQEWKIYYQSATGTTDMSPFAKRDKSERDCWLSQSDDPTVYWLSIDSINGRLRYGKWYTNTSMILLELDLKEEKVDPATGNSMIWKDAPRDSFLTDLKLASVIADGQDLTAPNVVINPLPIVVDLSPFVVSTDAVRLEDLETGKVTVSSNLPVACQQLYANVTGARLVLDDDDFPEFSQAIQYSCNTPGKWAYETLQAKSGEFGKKNLEGTYLRITLGYNGGNSPGVPYVMEIWPVGHYSPIHDHGNACAVIKVLHGVIHATYFNSLEQVGQFKIGTAKLTKNQVTWLGEQNYQIHQLKNTSNDVCVTIQCYAYQANENKHEDVFDYVDSEGKIVAWPPTSDCTFIEFKNKMRKEWEERSLQMDG